LHHALGPTARMDANQSRPIQQMIQTFLHDPAVRRMQMGRIGDCYFAGTPVPEIKMGRTYSRPNTGT